MVSALDFRSGGRWFEPGFRRSVVSLDKTTSFPGLFPFELGRPNSKGKSPGNEVVDKKLYSTLPLFTQVYKWVPAIIMLGGNLAMD